MQIAVGGFQHETNCFQSNPTLYQDFVTAGGWPGLSLGADIFAAVAGRNLAIAGFMDRARFLGHEPVPLVWANAQPAGPVEDQAFDRISEVFIEQLAQYPSLDAVYLDLHGAMVTDSHDDADSEFIRLIRSFLSRHFARPIPIIASHDWHGNVSPARIAQLDLLDSYQTYPHVDMAATGARLCDCFTRYFPRNRPLARRMVKTDYLIPLTAQCSLSQPMKGLLQLRAEIAAEFNLVLGFTPGFPPSDIAMVGPAVFAYGEDQRAVDEAVNRLVTAIHNAESDFAREEILTLAAAKTIMRDHVLGGGVKPLILADSQDNPGAGGSSDTTGVLQTAIELSLSLPLSLSPSQRRPIVLALFYAPVVASDCAAMGVGGVYNGLINGIKIRGRIAALHQGEFIATGPMWGDSVMNLGTMARLDLVAEDDSDLGVKILLASQRQQPSSQAMLRILGIEPKSMAIIVLKSSVHFRADFEAIAERVRVVAAPGVNLANPADFPYKKLRPNVRRGPNLAEG
ncbi:MAG: M81 family metallopeptidase [Candidatus Pacebacteria bacterium]|nr:M81 family metallopeptidase [Candidatus Paceibacterota bacterium]